MTDKRKVPEIRFKGFEGEWKEREFSGFVSRITSMSDDLDLPRIEYEDIISGSGILNKNVFNKVSTKKGIQFDEGDILFGKLRPYLNNLLLPDFKGIAVGDFWVLRVNETDAAFVYSFLQSSTFQYVANLSAGSKMPRSDWRIVSLSKFAIPPCINEQAHIGAFLKSLDSLINLRQRKYAKLSTVKKAMLEKMFPKGGADVPEIRFKGFTEKWKKRELGDLYSQRNERGNDSLQILSVSIHHGVSSGELDSDTLGKQVRRSENKSLYKRVHFGDLVFNMMRAWQGAIGVVKAEGMVSPAYITAVPNDEVFPQFMDCCMRRPHIISQMNNLSYGVTDFRKRLYWDSFIRVSCHIPSSVPEQAKIAEYFENLDSLLVLHQRELEKLKNLRKACLNKMFV